jgi:hypothetical protein
MQSATAGSPQICRRDLQSQSRGCQSRRSWGQRRPSGRVSCRWQKQQRRRSQHGEGGDAPQEGTYIGQRCLLLVPPLPPLARRALPLPLPGRWRRRRRHPRGRSLVLQRRGRRQVSRRRCDMAAASSGHTRSGKAGSCGVSSDRSGLVSRWPRRRTSVDLVYDHTVVAGGDMPSAPKTSMASRLKAHSGIGGGLCDVTAMGCAYEGVPACP